MATRTTLTLKKPYLHVVHRKHVLETLRAWHAAGGGGSPVRRYVIEFRKRPYALKGLLSASAHRAGSTALRNDMFHSRDAMNLAGELGFSVRDTRTDRLLSPAEAYQWRTGE